MAEYLIGQIEEQEVEQILDSRERRGVIEYLVHWKGFPRQDREWLRGSALPNATTAITDFHRIHPLAPRPTPRLVLRGPRPPEPVRIATIIDITPDSKIAPSPTPVATFVPPPRTFISRRTPAIDDIRRSSCSCPICRRVPVTSPSGVFATDDFKSFRAGLNRLPEHMFEFPPFAEDIKP
ncbi:hypothetical protein BU15DRAFT_84262 [Melanogaster broomeanus]|nr:hypothetical protein BU15DRAFT_84262 [Melanogaster broomeanus]